MTDAGAAASGRPLRARRVHAAQKALQTGDFAGYGRQIKALQTTLTELQALK